MNFQQLICSICLAAQQNPLKLQQCIHSFCSECISQWLDIKNNCPLCLNLIGNSQHNKLLVKPPEQVEFDSGALIFQSEVKAIDETMKNLDTRIHAKYLESKNFKCHFPKSSLNYVQDQMLLAKNYYSNLEESILTNDSVNASMYTQLITQVLLDIENVLNGGQIGKINDEQYQDQYCDSYSDQDYQEQEIKNARKQKARQKKAAIQQNGQVKAGKIFKL